MTKIVDLKEKDRLTQYLMVKSCTKGVTQKGAPYLNLVLQDNTGTIDGKFWDAKAADEAAAIPGKVAEISFEVLEYNRALQLRVNRIVPVDQKLIRIEEFLLSSAMNEETLRAKVQELVSSIGNTNLKALTEGMLAKVGKDFYEYPAASKIHHGYLGGLAEHTLGMAALAEETARLYPLLNRDLLIAGVLVHDMGKTKELGGLISGEYTTEGRLTGHISICHGWLMEVAAEKGLADSEEAMLLRHMVLSHHGRNEYGSPVLPEIPEAEALSLIDNMDARMNTLKTAIEAVKPGQWTAKMFALENRQFYHARLDRNED